MDQQYEAVFISSPVLSESQVKEAAKAYEKFIKSKGGEITATEYWGLKKLAYPIDKKKTGFYNLLQFSIPSQALSALDTEFIRDERVIRHLVVKLDKDALAWADERRKRMSDNK